MAMYAAGVGALCISSSVAAAFVMNKKDEVAIPAEQPEDTVEKKEVEEAGLAPDQPPPPPSEPAQKQLTTPNSMRSASAVWGDRGLNDKLNACGNSMIDSPGGWCATGNAMGSWIQLDNGKIGSISGVITQGRKNADQWVKSFKVKYKDESGSWWDVDGKTFPGNTNRNSKVTTTFSKPVRTRYIRIYPQTFHGHVSMRVDMIGGSTNTDKTPALGDLPYSNHKSSANWGGDAIGTSHGAGRLDSGRAWSALTAEQNAKTAWYQLGLNSPVNVSGVAMKGRPDNSQWITSVKIQYEDENGEFKGVDDGFHFDANYDKNSLVKIFFEKPIKTKTIRFYPQSWKAHASGRFGILRGGSSSTEGYQIMGYTL
tara:strand:- start:20 stop:1126 length:1107 start_codon:yes stop_codon:yes gene_type:complete